MKKIIVDNQTYILHEVETQEFALSSETPYPFEHRKAFEDSKTYIYQSIRFNGKFYGFKLEENTECHDK